MVSSIGNAFRQSAIILSLLFLAAFPAAAQSGPVSAAPASPQSTANGIHVYDAAQEVSIQGTVVKLADLQTSDSLSGEYLTLSTPQGIVNAHLGAAAILSRNQVTLKPGDKVSLAGAYVAGANGQVLLARILRTGNRMVLLRSASGLPLRPRAATHGSSVTFSSPAGGSR